MSAAPQTAAAGESVGRSAAWSLATRLATAAGTAVLTLFLLRRLGPEGYGVFALAVSFGALLLEPTDFGISLSTARYVAVHRTDRLRVLDVFAEGSRLRILTGVAVSAGLVALAGPIASAYGVAGLAWPIRWIAIALFGQGLLALYSGAFASLRNQAVGFRMVVSETVAETTLSIALVALGGGAAGAAAGRAAGYAVGGLVALAFTLRILGRRALPRRTGRPEIRRRIARYARSLFALELAVATNQQLSPLLLGALFNAATVGLYSAVVRLSGFLAYPGLALASAVAPRTAADDEHEADLAIFEVALRRLIAFQALLLPFVIAWAAPIVDLLLGERFTRSADVLQLLAPAIFFGGITPLVTMTFTYLGAATLRLRIALVTIVVDVALVLALVPTIGLNGAAIAASAAATYFVPVHLYFMRRRWGVPMRPVVVTTARALAAAAAATLLLVALGTGKDLPLWAWAAGIAGAPAVYVAVLLITRELGPADIRALAARVRRG